MPLLTELQIRKLRTIAEHLQQSITSIRELKRVEDLRVRIGPNADKKLVRLSTELKRVKERLSFVESLLDVNSYWQSMVESIPSAEKIRCLHREGYSYADCREFLTITGDDAPSAADLMLRYNVISQG